MAPNETARERIKHVLQRAGFRVIQAGVFPAAAELGTVRSALSVSQREREILSALLGYDQNQEIAEALGVSLTTVNWHLRNLMRRLGVKSRHRLIAKALLLGLLPTGGNEGPKNQ